MADKSWHKLSNREIATVLAALRTLQVRSLPGDLRGHFEDHSPLGDAEIDELCERINMGSAESVYALYDIGVCELGSDVYTTYDEARENLDPRRDNAMIVEVLL